MTARADVPIVHLLASRPVALVLATALIVGLYVATLFSSFSLYAERVLFPDASAETVAQNVNLLIMVVGLAAAFSQIVLIAPLVRWLGEQRLVVIGGLLLGSALGISSGLLPVGAHRSSFVAWLSVVSVMVFVVLHAHHSFPGSRPMKKPPTAVNRN
ncbi:MAG: hypothetical protein K8L99_16500 [Anaerolineae bacterium]|nr:hypothetical protein [Anaerolineae bacterium]